VRGGHLDAQGYSTIWYQGRLWRACTLTYTWAWGPPPDDLIVYPACGNRRCCNVQHLALRPRTRDVLERLLDKVEQLPPDVRPTGCWRWMASLTGHGYGQINVNGRPRRAHVVAYTLLVGPIPAGMELDHLCRRRWCCNPLHVEPVTRRTNFLRSEHPCAEVVRTTRCRRGHELTPENTVINNPKTGGRTCRICRNERARERARERWHTDPEFRRKHNERCRRRREREQAAKRRTA
jgi:hypothetical protein